MARCVLLRHAFPVLCTDQGHIPMHLAFFKHLLHTSLVSYTCQGHIPSYEVLFHQLFHTSLGSYKDQISGTNFSRYGFLRTGSTHISWASTVKFWRGEKFWLVWFDDYCFCTHLQDLKVVSNKFQWVWLDAYYCITHSWVFRWSEIFHIQFKTDAYKDMV